MKTSKDPRHQARKLALGCIYSIENSKENDYSKIGEEIIKTSQDNLEIEKYDKKLFDILIKDISDNISKYKNIIGAHSIDWDIDKIYKIDLSVLLLAVSELNLNNAPIKVIVDEAVELAKEFGENESAKFVNGVLAGVIKSIDSTKSNDD